jgi:hypothetical protein
VFDASATELAGTANKPVDLVASIKQKPGEIGAILTCDTGY